MAEELTLGYREAEHTAIDEHTSLTERPVVTDVPSVPCGHHSRPSPDDPRR